MARGVATERELRRIDRVRGQRLVEREPGDQVGPGLAERHRPQVRHVVVVGEGSLPPRAADAGAAAARETASTLPAIGRTAREAPSVRSHEGPPSRGPRCRFPAERLDLGTRAAPCGRPNTAAATCRAVKHGLDIGTVNRRGDSAGRCVGATTVRASRSLSAGAGSPAPCRSGRPVDRQPFLAAFLTRDPLDLQRSSAALQVAADDFGGWAACLAL